MAVRSLLNALGASPFPGCQLLLARTPQRLCNFRNSTFGSHLYSTQRTKSALPEGKATSESESDQEIREDVDYRQRHADRYRRWYARKVADDPAYRAIKNQRSKEWHTRKLANDPEYRATLSQKAKDWLARKCASDQRWDEERRHAIAMRYRNPEHHEELKHYYRAYDQLRRDREPGYKMRKQVRQWIMNYDWVREGLDWTPWHPVLYPERVEHQCRECGTERHGGARLW
jgi:hypothetical protein